MVSCGSDESGTVGTGRDGDQVVMTNGGKSALSAVCQCLSHRRRRVVLYYLRDRGTATVEELARHIVAYESDRPPDEIDESELTRVETELHHVHLPKLVDALIAEYDARSNTVRYSDPPGELKTFLDFAERIERGGESSGSTASDGVRRGDTDAGRSNGEGEEGDESES